MPALQWRSAVADGARRLRGARDPAPSTAGGRRGAGPARLLRPGGSGRWRRDGLVGPDPEPCGRLGPAGERRLPATRVRPGDALPRRLSLARPAREPVVVLRPPSP